MLKKQPHKLVVAISSRALFDLNESHEIYESEGIEAYRNYQCKYEHTPLAPGPAFNLVKKFLLLNADCPPDDPLVEVLLLSRNSADTGLRIFHSIAHHHLQITRAAFSGGKSPYVYAKAFGADLFLSLHTDDVRQAIAAGCAAASIWPGNTSRYDTPSLNIAFDGDAVLFSDEAERIFKTQGLCAFNESEQASAHLPLMEGPFKNFLVALHRLQQQALPIPIRTALVTARSVPAHERVINTLRQWNIRLDESLFLGGMEKVDFLTAFQADLFFDDQKAHCEKASTQVTSGHVPYGVANEKC